MCVDHRMMCECGKNTASINFRDEIMPPEAIDRLYCPQCSEGVPYRPDSMLRDNGWIIEYDMDVAKFAGRTIPVSELTPAYLFDEGYCSWRGVYPNDHEDSRKEREELISLAKVNPKKYLEEFRRWGTTRMERLASEGWRKANAD